MSNSRHPVRLARAIGRVAELRIYWDPCTYASGVTVKYAQSCPNAYGMGGAGGHDATRLIARRECDPNSLETIFGAAADYPAEAWPTHCDHCGAPVPAEGVGMRPPASDFTGDFLWGGKDLYESALWDTPSGQLEVGSCWWATPEGRGHLYSHDERQCYHWDNCNGRHLRVVLPDRHHWDVMGRASNCDMRENRTHRCWVLQGTAEQGNLSVNKDGDTCHAGAGSIKTDTYHGMLAGGVLDGALEGALAGR